MSRRAAIAAEPLPPIPGYRWYTTNKTVLVAHDWRGRKTSIFIELVETKARARGRTIASVPIYSPRGVRRASRRALRQARRWLAQEATDNAILKTLQDRI